MANAPLETLGKAADNVQDKYDDVADNVKDGVYKADFKGMYSYQKDDLGASISNTITSGATKSIINAVKETVR